MESCLGTWDLQEYGFWIIGRISGSNYGIFKYTPNTGTFTQMSTIPSNISASYERFGMGVDQEGNLQISGLTPNSTTSIAFARSPNGGVSWQTINGTISNPGGYESWCTHYATTGDTEIWGGASTSSGTVQLRRPYRRFSNQTAMVTASTLDVFGDNELITKLGDEANPAYRGNLEITNRAAGQIQLVTAGIWQDGDVVVSRAGGVSQTATKYLVLDSVGNVTNISSADPGFTTMGPGTEIDLTFPATFPSGDAPDTELPAGAAIQVEVEATNSVASDTYPSSTITPA